MQSEHGEFYSRFISFENSEFFLAALLILVLGAPQVVFRMYGLAKCFCMQNIRFLLCILFI